MAENKKIIESSKITAVIHTKNEENNISECIKSVKPYVDEVILIDMKSSDKTVSIAKKLGAKVFSHKDMGYSRPARQFGIQKASHNWIFWLDADERVPRTLGRQLRKIATNNQCDLVIIPHKNVILGKWFRHTGWWPDYHYRLFKKGHLWESIAIHTPPKVKGKELKLDALEENAIVHRGHTSISNIFKKYLNYAELDTTFSMFVNKRNSISPKELFGYPESEFRWRYVVNEGYKDGFHGFMLSKLKEIYRYIEISTYWEKNNYKDLVEETELKKYILNKMNEENKIEEFRKIELSKFYKLWKLYNKIKSRAASAIKKGNIR